jgi:alpha-galactosidase
MAKITFIGGGSAKFVRELTVDIFSYPEFADSHVALMDIDVERLARSQRIV